MSDPITPLTPEQTAIAEQKALHESYLHRALVGLDQFMNVLTDGDPDETISARSARAEERGKEWGVVMCKFLNVFQKDHGAQAQAGDTARAEQVEKLEAQSGGIESTAQSGQGSSQ